MKKTVFYVTGIIILSILFSCKKDEITDENNLSVDEAAEIAGASLSSGNGGNSAQFEDAANYSEQIITDTISKETLPIYDTTFTISKDTGRITFNYSFHYQYGMRYNNDTQMFEYSMNYDTDGRLQSLRLYSEDSSEGNLILTGLEQSEDFFVINGSVTRTGNQTVSIQEKKSVSTVVIVNFNDIKVRKSDYKITEGSGDISVKGKTSEGKEFLFTGTLIYKDDGTIILTLNGEEYIIDTTSGEIQN